MKTRKRWLAAFLAAMLLLGALPAAALEEIRDETQTPALEETTGEIQTPENPEDLENQETQENQEDPKESEPSQEETEDAGEPASLEGAVVYNLGTYNTAVLPAALEEAMEDEAVYEAIGAFMMERQCQDLLFLDEEGGFAIPLPEDEPFFPYAVQFQYQDETWTEWFDTEDSAVTVGEYSFTLSLKEGAEPLYIDGPEDEVHDWLAKDFATDGDPAATMSLQNLETYNAYVTISKEELKESYSLKSLIEMVKEYNSNAQLPAVSDDTTVVWQVYESTGFSESSDLELKGNGRYVIGKASDVVNVAEKVEEYGGYYTYYEFIVGKAGHNNSDQNDGEKCRFELSIDVGNRYIRMRPYGADKKPLSEYETTMQDGFYDRGTNKRIDKNSFNASVYASKWTGSEPVYLKLSRDYRLEQFLNQAGAGAEAKVYVGYYETPEEIPANAEDVTSKILLPTRSTSDSAWNSLEGYRVQLSSLEDWSYWDKVPKFTLVLEKNGTVEKVLAPFGVRFYSAYAQIQPDYELYNETSNWVAQRVYENGHYTTNYVMKDNSYPADAEYYFRMRLNNAEPDEDVTDYVESITVNGTALSQTQITQLFDSDNYSSPARGYKANYSSGVTFTIKYTAKYHSNPSGTEIFTVKTIPSNEDPGNLYDTFFQVNGASGCSSYVMKAKDDGYFKYGYQTVLLMKGSAAVTDERITPYFSTQAKSLQAKTVKDASAVSQELDGSTSIHFTPGQPVQYTAYVDETSSTHRNYWVTFATKTSGGPNLFVNGVTNADAGHLDDGQPTRLVVMDDAKDYHDVFVANLGDAPMTGLYARLENAQNVVLDPYWSFQENTSLAAFPDRVQNNSNGYQQNIAKVRLLPEVDEATGLLKGGPISGTLVIGYGGGGAGKEVRVKLTGLSGDLQFTNQSLRTGVKWVPYVTAIQDNTMIDSENYEYSITGRLPNGLSTTPAGEIYGVPQEYGTFPLHVTLRYKGDVSTLLGGVGNLLSAEEKEALQKRLSCEGDLELNILNNTDVNVWTVPTDESYSYAVETAVGTDTGNYHFTVDSYADRIFQSEGPYDQFANFYLDGKLLTRDVDYTAEEGSTVITIKEQTFRNAGGGTHTIAAEFFPGGKKTDANVRSMRTTSQNYTLTIGGSSSGGGSGSSGGGSSSSGKPGTIIANTPSKPSTTPKPATPKPTPAPETTPKPVLPFTDVPQDNTFYEDILWVFDNGLMIGTADDTFAPKSTLTAAAIVTVLARMAKVDLEQYRNVEDGEIDSSLWYAPAAIWAKQSGLLPEAGTAIFQAPLQREQMAVMLVKYMKLRGAEVPAPEEPVDFADADQMSPEGNAAFQTLYQCGVFKGTGGGAMDPAGVTNRGQFAALLHRVNGILEENSESAQ